MSGRPLRWVLAGGGTGGHVTPLLALCERISARGDDLLVLGGERGLEARLVPEAGFELEKLPARQIMGQGVLARLGAVPAIAAACLSAWRKLRGADLVVSVGGYASVPAALAALARRLPLALVEPNAIPGRANLLVARFAHCIFVQFAAAAERFPAERVVVSGIPLRRALLDAIAEGGARRLPSPPFRLLVFGGSQGARQINEAMMELAPSLDAASLEIFHQAGETDRDRVAEAYRAAGVRAEVVAFEPDMPRRYRWADLAVCRAGALTVAELALAGLPSLLVPYPHAADDHQSANARALSEVQAARVLASRPLSARDLGAALSELLEKPSELARMAAAARRLAHTDAAEKIVATCAALVHDDAGQGGG